MTEEKTELTLPSRIDSIAKAAELAADAARRAGLGDEALFGIDMAVREAVTNAVLHGNRQNELKRVTLRIEDEGAQIAFEVADEGEGFDPAAVADPTDEQNLLKTSGRGILFMKTFMDEVEWAPAPSGRGTLVRMSKKK